MSGPTLTRSSDLGARPRLLGVLPALAVSLFAFAAGTFESPMRTGWVLVGHGILALLALIGASAGGLDPLDLGRRWRLLLPLVFAIVTIGWVRSPVGGLGVDALALLMLAPFAARGLAACWSCSITPACLVIVLGAVSSWAWLSLLYAPPPPALPIGHHNLLGAWTVSMLPFVALLEGRARWRLGMPIALLALALIVETGSLGALIGLGVAALVALWIGPTSPDRRSRWPSRGKAASTILVAVAVVGVALWFNLPRLAEMVHGRDTSARARLAYVDAAMDGMAARPWLGWGPAASRTLIVQTLRPIPGVHPAGQVVADPHSLPLRIGFDHGVLGLLFGILLLARIALRRASDASLSRVAIVAAVAFGTASLFGRPLAAGALGMVALIIVGARLAAGSREAPGGGRVERGVAALLVLGGMLALVPIDRARLAYQRAAYAEDDALRLAALRSAVHLDPRHPLYRARLADLEGDAAGLRAAAKDAVGVAPLWLVSASVTRDAGDDSRPALLRACALDPLAPMAPMRLAAAAPDDPRAVGWAARALIAEPRLLAATLWRTQPRLRAEAVARVQATTGIDSGWRVTFADVARRIVPDRPVATPLDAPALGAEDTAQLAIWADRDAGLSMSLHVFARTPWPWRLGGIEVDADQAAAIDLRSAASLDTTDAEVFSRGVFAGEACGLRYAAES